MFGLVGPVGVDLDPVEMAISQGISVAGYTPIPIRLSRLIEQAYGLDTKNQSEGDRIELLMRAGTLLREKSECGEAVALLGVSEIVERRKVDRNKAEEKTAFILRSLKHPREVTQLRAIYGKGFVLISVYSPRDTRVKALAEKISRSKFGDKTHARAKAERLIEIDESEEGTSLGQDVRDAFPLADFFVDSSDLDSLRSDIRRFLHAVLGNRFITPSRDENGMYHARAAALRSADMNRQVGAAIVRPSGEILTLGCNDVPKAGGDQYWEGDKNDQRDFKRGIDSSAQQRVLMLNELFNRLKDNGFLIKNDSTKNIDELVRNLTTGKFKEVLKGVSIANLLEFGRSVHAEMAALSSAARLGIAVEGATLYTTTFPCHMCARHIVAAGIKKVVYIEPYPKSRAEQLHSDAIAVDPVTLSDDHVNFVAFKGISPKQYQEIFDAGDLRKTDEGKIREWKMSDGNVRFQRYINTYREIETNICASIFKLEEIAKISYNELMNPSPVSRSKNEPLFDVKRKIRASAQGNGELGRREKKLAPRARNG